MSEESILIVLCVAAGLIGVIAVAYLDFLRALDRWENQRDKNED